MGSEFADVPSGEYIGFASLKTDDAPELEEIKAEPESEEGEESDDEEKEEKAPKPALKKQAEKKNISITFLPKSQDVTDGVGVAVFDHSSERFYWRSDGNNQDTWNVLFTKDSNLYSNIKSTFKFTGIVTARATENKIVGNYYIDDDGKISDYYVEAFQYFMPEIIPPKEAIAVKAGEVIQIEAMKAGENQKEIKAILDSTGEDEKTYDLKVQRFEKAKDEANKNIFIKTKEGLSKGEYLLHITRSGQHESNSVPVNII